MAMEREYFCEGCGLYFFGDQYGTSCPNPDCATHNHYDLSPIPVDSMGYAYFAIDHGDDIEEMSWSSEKYAPKEAIEIYRKQGVKIKN